MISELLKEINFIIDFEIEQSEELTREQRAARMLKFRKELSVEKYSALFNKIENILLDENVQIDEKDTLISEFLRLLSYYNILQERNEQFPPLLKQLYKTHALYRRLCLLLEVIEGYEFASPINFEQIILDYFDFLENPNNEFYIHYCYSKINILNKKILDYLNKKDYKNERFEDVINNPVLIQSLKNEINELSNKRD